MWARDARTASRTLRARVRPASSGAEASSAVSRSSTAETRLDPTAQPPATWSEEPACRSSGMSTRANQATSSSAAVKSASHARRRRALTRSGTATATASATAASSHHNQEGAPVVASDEPAADDKVVDDGDGLGDSVKIGLAESVAVGVSVGVSGRIGDWVGLGIVDVDVGVGVGVGVSERIGDRVGLGIVDVGVGSALAERDDVTDGRASGEPFPPHEMSNTAAVVRPTARITSGSETAVSNPALVVISALSFVLRGGQTEPCVHVTICGADLNIGGSRRAVARRERCAGTPAFRTGSPRHVDLVGQLRPVQPLADLCPLPTTIAVSRPIMRAMPSTPWISLPPSQLSRPRSRGSPGGHALVGGARARPDGGRNDDHVDNATATRTALPFVLTWVNGGRPLVGA